LLKGEKSWTLFQKVCEKGAFKLELKAEIELTILTRFSERRSDQIMDKFIDYKSLSKSLRLFHEYYNDYLINIWTDWN